MSVRLRGEQLPAAGGSSAIAAAASFSYIAAAEPERLDPPRLQQADSRTASSHTASKDQNIHHLLQDSSPLGLEGFYSDSNSATAAGEFFLSNSEPSSFQAVMETSSEANNNGMEEEEGVKERQRGQRQAHPTVSSLQLRSPVPGDTASPCSHHNGVSLQARGSSGKFISELCLPDMPTPSLSAAGINSSSPPPSDTNDQDSPTVLLSEMVSPSSFKINLEVDHKDTTTMDISTEDESHGEHVTCLWDSCQQEFPSLARLVVHLDRCHTLAMAQFVCHWENCPRQLKPFDARYKLTTHLRCHTGEKPYQCEVTTCKRSFSRLENLKLHTRTHTGEKPYQCHYATCSKKFNNTSDRAKHMKTHITRKPYACKHPGCNKSYTDPSSMRKHIKYTHKLKKDSDGGGGGGGGLSLAALPRRKRNSNSCSSSSSSSSTPQTPQQPSQMQQQLQGAILLHSPPATPLHDNPHPILQTVSLSSPIRTTPLGDSGGLFNGCSTIVSTSTPQIIPVVKLQGGGGGGVGQSGQPLLLPAYQQPPLMMILPSSSSMASCVGHTMSSTSSSTSITGGISSVPLTLLPNQLTPQYIQTHPATTAVAQVIPHTQQHCNPAHPNTTITTTSSSSSASVEDQLRLHIAHLQQQLYQSQLAVAAAAATTTCTNTTTREHPAPTPSSQSSVVGASRPVVVMNNSRTRLHAQLEVSAAQGTASLPRGTNTFPVLSPHRKKKLKADLGRTSSLPEMFASPQPTARLLAAVQPAGSVGQAVISSSVPVLSVGGSGRGGRGPMLVSTSSMPVLGVGGTTRAMVPQFIPIPLVHSKGVTAEPQFVYMSP